MDIRQWIWVPVAAALLGSCPGCSGRPSVDSSTTEAKVTGSVRIRHKPMTEGEITFDPSNYKRKDEPPRSAKLKSDGTYEITTLTGLNTVTIAGPAIAREPELGYAGKTLDVQSGTNSLDIDLPPEKQ